jgi:hypothetical protein
MGAMTALRTFMSMPLAVVAAMTLMGCYDLSTDGPHRDDFVRTKGPTQGQDEDQGQQTTAEVRCGDATTPCNLNANAAKTDALLDLLEEYDSRGIVEMQQQARSTREPD